MNLLFFASDYRIGLSALLTQQAVALQKGGLHPLCLAGEKEQEPGLSGKMQENGVNLVRIPGLDEHSRFMELSNQIGKIIQENHIRYVHVQNNWQLLLIAFYKYKHLIPKPIRIIYTLHGFRHNYSVRSVVAIGIIGLLLFFFAGTIIVMSDYVQKRFSWLSYKMKKLYLGVDDTYFEKTGNEVDIEKLKLVFPAQFREGKNQSIMIEAIASYIARTNDHSIELHLPGSGSLLDECKRIATTKGVEKNIYFPGQLTKLQIRDLYEQCNIGVVSSNTETFGQSIVEPFVLGRCVVSRRVGVATDILQEGVNGLFFDNEKDLMEILVFLSQNKSLIREMGNANFSQRSIFSWKIVTVLYKNEIIQ